jgi:hypothetical protein
MRRLSAVLLSLLLTQIAFAAVKEDPHAGDRERLGRAMVLTPRQALSESDVADLAKEGISVKRAIAGGRYIARVQDEAQAGADARIVSLEPMTARQKLQPSVIHEAAKAKPYARVNVIFQDDVDFDAARNAILQAGGELDDLFRVRFSPSHRLTARVPTTALDALVADERVMTIIGPSPRRIVGDNLTSAIFAHVDEVQAAPYGLSGEGVNVSLFELADPQSSHVEFGGRLVSHAIGGSASDKSHATHVAGTIGAAGVQANAKGMAPKAHIDLFCLQVPANQCTEDWLDLKDTALQPLGITADNNSWGYELGWFDEDGFPVYDGSDIIFGSYVPDYGGPFVDEISIDRKVLFIHSAGNNGNSGGFSTDFSQHRHTDDNGDTITSEIFCYSKDNTGHDCPALCNGTDPITHAPAGCELISQQHQAKVPFDTMGVVASAKNVIAVGAVATGAPGNIQIASLSSRGPAKDGRVKPDIVARGVNVLSPVPTDSYERKQGTSMASPVVTGIAVLLTEQWRKTFGGASPLPEQLKALLLAGADDLGNPGPDYTYGFGMANAKAAVDLIRNDGGTGARIRNLTFAQGSTQSVEYSINLPPSQNLRVLLNWADPPTVLLADDDIATPVLINDLDLKVIDPSGITVLPYVLDKAAYTANATRGVNKVDNTEEVEITNAVSGAYRVIVTAAHVPEGPQGAVLVANATLAQAAPPCIDPIEQLGSNDSPATAFGNLAPGQLINAIICSADDNDYYKFVATKAGPVSVTVTATQTPLLAVLSSGAGFNSAVDVPFGQSRTINATATTVPQTFLLQVRGGPGTVIVANSGTYSFTTHFGETNPPRRRSVGR